MKMRIAGGNRHAVLLLLFVVVATLFYRNHQNTLSVINESRDNQRALVEQNVLSSLTFADSSYRLIELHQNRQMEEYSHLMVELYQTNPQVSTWDLDGLREQFGDYEIYLVNEDLVIERTTFAPDLGMDFKKYPSFAELIRSRLQGDSFSADRMDIATATGRLNKYSYMPTPDHKYLLELSIDIGRYYPMMENLNVFSQADAVAANHNIVDMIRFYKFDQGAENVGVIVREGGPYVNSDIPADYKEMIRRVVLASEESISHVDSQMGDRTHRYIPYFTYREDGEIDWWGSYVVGITYDDSLIHQEVMSANLLFGGQMSIIGAIFIAFGFFMNNMLKRTEKMASIDPLTSLPNRRVFEENFSRAISAHNSRKIGHRLALLFIDLNDFKKVNDSLGHNAGDQLLKDVADRLRRVLRREDVVTRMGGDEFLVLLTGISSMDDVRATAGKVTRALETPYVINGHRISIAASIGISLWPEHGHNVDELIRRADTAMYQAKLEKDAAKGSITSLYGEARP